MVELPYPAAEGGPRRRNAAVGALLDAGFESWRDKILGRYLRLDQGILSSPDLQERVLDFTRESFRLIASSGVFALASEALERPQLAPTADCAGASKGKVSRPL